MCQPKLNGRLGLRPAKGPNDAFLMKLSWEVFRNSQTLWVDVLKSKYDGNSRRVQASCLWKAIQKQDVQVMKGATWAIGNGRLAKFWLGMGSCLLELAALTVPLEDQCKSVRDC